MAAIAGSTAALLYIAAQDRSDQLSYQPGSALGTVTVSTDLGAGGSVTPSAADTESRLRRLLPVDAVAPLVTTSESAFVGGESTFVQPLVRPASACPVEPVDGTPSATEQAALENDPRCASPFYPGGRDVLSVNGTGMLVDDGTALGLLTGVEDPAAATALRAGRVVVFDPEYLWPDGTVHLQVDVYPPDGGEATETRQVALPGALVSQTPRIAGPVLPQSALSRLGLEPATTGYVAGTTRMPTGDEEDRAAAAIEDVGGYLTVERGYRSQYGIGLLALVVAAVVVTLGGTFTAVGLAAAEGRADHATLAAVGASPGLRRRLAASQAGVIAGLGAVLGVSSGVLAGWALIRLRQPEGAVFGPGVQGDSTWELAVPWLHLLAVGIGVPVLTVLIGFLTTRSRLPLVRRLGQ